MYIYSTAYMTKKHTCIRSIVHPLREAIHAVFVGAKSLIHRSSCSHGDGEANTSEERNLNTVEKALMSIGGNWNARLAVQKVLAKS